MYEGYIYKVYKNFGVLKAEINNKNVKLLFYIYPDMVNGKGFRITRKVTFDLTVTQVRGIKMQLAYNLKSIKSLKMHNFKFNDYESIKIDDYHNFIYKRFYKEDGEILNELIEKDKRFKESILKWVLFLEQNLKDVIIASVFKYKIDRKKIYKELAENFSTKKLHNDIMKKLKKNYMFRKEFELLSIDRSNSGDIKNFEIKDAPLALYLENTTVDELGKLLNVISDKFFCHSTVYDDEKIIFMEQIKEMFPELSLIRNACAHGNPFVPLILDDNYSPSYLYDLSSVDPHFNSGDSVTDWKLFEPLRWTMRQLTKRGMSPFYKGGLQVTGLYTAKYILINPARRSFFSFLYIIEFYFRYVDVAKKNDFTIDLKDFILIFGEDENIESNMFNNYPKENPVFHQILKFIYPLYFEDAFWILAHEL